MPNRVLFILKRREDYSSTPVDNPRGLSTGLFNSASFMEQMLAEHSRAFAMMEVAIDNNCIDRLVTKHKPTHVVIEALWVVPSKFEVLTKLHPKVKWIVRLHSEMPFMAGEGMAMNWIMDYLSYENVSVGVNAPRMLDEVRVYTKLGKGWPSALVNKRVIYMPNFYPQHYVKKLFDYKKEYVDVGCFGAVRPLKNHLVQAFGALKFANKIKKKLRFHINVGRQEMKGEPVLHNLKAVFMQLAGTGHELVMHEWVQREDFLKLCATMDIGMQCNFSETFNIVGADLVSQGVPLVATKEVPWASRLFNADPNSSDNVAKVLECTYDWPELNVWLNQRNLTKYTNKTIRIWSELFY